MFSREYFTYLFKSKKYLLIFILVITLLNIIGTGNDEVSLVIQGFLCTVLAYLIPCHIFSYVHDKKAVDTYFSIPVSRKAMLITGIIFCAIVAYVPFVLSFTFYAVSEDLGILVLVTGLLKMLLVALTLVCFNTSLYLIGNNVFDGITMLAAYSVLPAILLGALEVFGDSFVAGRGFDTSFVSYLSPIFISADMFLDIVEFSMVDIRNVVALILYLVLSAYLLYRFYVEREVERAGTPSDKFYSYPLVIYLYVFLILFMISSSFNYGYGSFGEFISDMFIVYLMLFVVFVVAHFIYKRKLYFSYKFPLFFVIAAMLTLGFTSLARSTKGFGLSQSYDHNDKLGGYTLYTYFDGIPSEIKEAFVQIDGVDIEDTYLYCIVSANEKSDLKVPKKEISENSLALFEKYRQSGIDYFYNKDGNAQKSNLNIVSSDGHYYYYGIKESVAYSDLLEFAKDPVIKVVLNNNSGEFELQSDGTLRVLTIYMD